MDEILEAFDNSPVKFGDDFLDDALVNEVLEQRGTNLTLEDIIYFTYRNRRQ